MTNNKYLLVDKSILPPYFEKVIEARELLAGGATKDVSKAVKMVGISRSTYYKYKDYVFATNSTLDGRKAIISFLLSHKPGILSKVLTMLSENGANILTITQNLPINSRAHVILTIDVSTLSCEVEALVKQINKIEMVGGAKLISIE